MLPLFISLLLNHCMLYVVDMVRVSGVSPYAKTNIGYLEKSGTKAVGAADTHVTIVPYFTVPDGKMQEFAAGFSDFFDKTRAGTDKCLYYNFAVSENTVFCREGYADAEGALQHLQDVGTPLGAALELVGEGGLDLSVMGPAEELEKLRPTFGGLGARFWETPETWVSW